MTPGSQLVVVRDQPVVSVSESEILVYQFSIEDMVAETAAMVMSPSSLSLGRL